jgi:hypothetical protein
VPHYRLDGDADERQERHGADRVGDGDGGRMPWCGPEVQCHENNDEQCNQRHPQCNAS